MTYPKSYWRERWRLLMSGMSLTERRAYNLAKFHRLADQRAARGLTTRGTERVQAVKVGNVRLSAAGRVRVAAANCERIKAEATVRAMAVALLWKET